MALTLQNMMDEVWEMLGEPTDLDPSTPAGSAKLTRWLNMAQRRIAGWKFPDGHVVRFPTLYDTAFFSSVTAQWVAGPGATATTVPLAGTGLPTEDDWYNNWVAEISGEYRVAVDYGGGVMTVAPSLSTAPSLGDTVNLYKGFYDFLPSSNPMSLVNIKLDPSADFIDLMKIEDISNMTVLEQDSRTEDNILTRAQIGTPSTWRKYGTRIWFDVAPDTVYYYKIEYYRSPRNMALTTDYPEIPEAWHDGIVLYARWWGYSRGQETGMAYSAKRDFQEFMQLTRQSFEMGYELIDGSIEVER